MATDQAVFKFPFLRHRRKRPTISIGLTSVHFSVFMASTRDNFAVVVIVVAAAAAAVVVVVAAVAATAAAVAATTSVARLKCNF